MLAQAANLAAARKAWNAGRGKGGPLVDRNLVESSQDAPVHRQQRLFKLEPEVGRLGGQMRVLPGAVIGWDMSAALALGGALGVPALAMAELLPVIEAVMVAKLNEQMEHSHG